MSRQEKLRSRLAAIPADFTWDELTSVLKGFGFDQKMGGGGSARFFVKDGVHKVFLHEPHPKNIVKQCYLREIVKKLKDLELI